jgi:hypothetical protein
MYVNSTYSISDEDTEWLKNLQRTAPGRHLDEHFKCVDFVISNKNRTECPTQQVATFRRIFCRAFAENDRCFGLPRPTPKFIAIVNLSGYRTILYSNRSTLIRLLTMVGPEASQRVMTSVEQVLKHANQHNTSVLFCFSLPWQAGVHQVHWEARTLERKVDGTVRDGAKCYSYTHEEVRTCAPTTETEVGDRAQMQAQMDAMAKHYAACNVDVIVDNDLSNAEDDSERMRKLNGVMSSVKADRVRLLGEIQALREAQTLGIVELSRESDERVGKIVDAAQLAAAVSAKKIKELQTKITQLTEENSTLTKARAEADRSKAEQDLLFGHDLKSLQARTKVHEISAKSATDKLMMLQKSATREREALERGHSKQVEDLERRLSDKTIECRKVLRASEEGSSLISRLDDVVEQMRTEKQALQFENINRRKKVIGLQCALAVACNEHSKCVAAAALDRDAATALQNELQQMLAHAESAAHSAETEMQEMSKDMDKMNKELETERKKKRPKTPPTPPPPPEPPAPEPPADPPPEKAVYARSQEPCEFTSKTGKDRAVDEQVITEPASWLCERTMASVGEQTAPTKSKVDEELEALSERFVKLGDEKSAWTAREAELLQQIQNLECQLHGQLQEQQGQQGQLQNGALGSVPSPTGMTPNVAGETHVKQQVYNNVYNHVVVPNGANAAGGWQQMPVDLGVDPNGDAGMEAVVGQAQLSLRALVDMARAGNQHKQAADNMWSELQAMKRFTSADCNGGWVAPAAQGFYGEMVPIPQQHWVPPPPQYLSPGARQGNTKRR